MTTPGAPLTRTGAHRTFRRVTPRARRGRTRVQTSRCKREIAAIHRACSERRSRGLPCSQHSSMPERRGIGCTDFLMALTSHNAPCRKNALLRQEVWSRRSAHRTAADAEPSLSVRRRRPAAQSHGQYRTGRSVARRSVEQCAISTGGRARLTARPSPACSRKSRRSATRPGSTAPDGSTP